MQSNLLISTDNKSPAKTAKFPRAGYRVHFDRLRDIRAEASFIRTHKFKCAIPKAAEKELKEKFEKVAKVVDSSEEGSLLWFLVQLYGLGFLFVPKKDEKIILLGEIYSDSLPDEIENIFLQLSTELKKQITTQQSKLALFSFLTTRRQKIGSKVHDGFLPQSILGDLGKIFDNDVKITEKNLAKFPIIKKFHDALLDLVYKKGNLFIDDIQNLFGVKVDLKDSEGTTFVIQEIPLSELQKNCQIGIDIFTAYFKYLMPAAQKTGRDIQSLAGVSDKQNALSNFLNITLKAFRKSTENCKRLISYGNPKYFQENPDILDFLAKAIHEISQRFSTAEENDFIAQDWSQYRALVGGRLQGWLSNFQNRLADYEITLTNNIHQKEIEQWLIPDNIRNALLAKVGNNSFWTPKKQLQKKFEEEFFDDVNPITKETKSKPLKDFRFWGKGKEKGDFAKRFNSIPKSHISILNTIQESCDWQNIFPEDVKIAFEQMRILQPILLSKLRTVTLGIPQEFDDPRTLGEALEEYRQFLQIAREFLMKWVNEGIPKKPDYFDLSGNEEIVIWKNKENKPDKFWISEKILKEKKKKKSDNGDDQEVNELNMLGFWSDEMVPNEFKKYPSFIGQAKKASQKEKDYAKSHLKTTPTEQKNMTDEQIKIFNAKSLLLDYTVNGEVFCCSLEKQKDLAWEEKNWFETKKIKDGKLEMVWALGVFHKTLESLRKIAQNSRNSFFIIKFLDAFVEKNHQNSESWNKFFSDFKNIENPAEKLKKIRFYLSGKEYSKQWKEIPTSAVSLEEFMQRFEKYFGLEKNMSRGRFESFFEMHSDGIGKDIATKGELLKLWWALRMKSLAEKLHLDSFDEAFCSFVKEWVSLQSILVDPQNGKIKPAISKKLAHRFLQSGFGSEIRGKIGLLSRKEFIQRNVLQITNGEQSLLQYVPREWGDFSHFNQQHQEKLKKKQRNHTFSQKAQKTLQNFDIDFKTSNIEIAGKIWQKLVKISSVEQTQSLLQVLGEMPHSWEMVLMTRQKIDNLENSPQKIQQGLFIEKSQDKKTYNFKTNLGKVFGYSFPVETSRYQKQFLERFLWGDRDQNNKKILTEKITGPSVILERTINVHWQDGNVQFSEKDFEMYLAVPFKFLKDNNKGVSKIEKGDFYRQSVYEKGENLLGIDLGEKGFGYAVFDPKSREFIKDGSGFQKIPLLEKLNDEAANWKDTQSRGIFSRPTTYLAEIRKQAAGQIRNQIHRLALKYNAKPIYEDSVDAFESGGQRISKLYKTLKTADVLSGNNNDADRKMKEDFWGTAYAQTGGVIGASKTSQTCRKCGRCATSTVEKMFENTSELKIPNQQLSGIKVELPSDKLYKKNEIIAAIKKQQRGRGEDGGQSLFMCQFIDCRNSCHADEQAARNIALKYFFFKDRSFENERKDFEKLPENKDKISISLPFFLKKSQEIEWKNSI